MRAWIDASVPASLLAAWLCKLFPRLKFCPSWITVALHAAPRGRDVHSQYTAFFVLKHRNMQISWLVGV